MTLLNPRATLSDTLTELSQAVAFVSCRKEFSEPTECPVSKNHCIEESLDLGDTTSTLARFVHAQAIGWPDSGPVR